MKIFISKTLALIVFSLLFVCHVFAGGKSDPRLITVTGDAEVRVAPDEVILTLGVETFDKNLGVSKNQNDVRVEKILRLAKKFNIKKKYIQTSHISIEPKYESYHYLEKDHLKGYVVRKTVVFTLKDVSKFEELLTAVLEAGANYIHGIQFRTTELRKYRDQARALAIKAAQEKADALAGELGQKLGKPYTIREQPTWWGSWYNSWWGAGGGRSMAQNVVQNVGSGYQGGESTIALGQITISARVTVSFELK